jgi:hypothetical protein
VLLEQIALVVMVVSDYLILLAEYQHITQVVVEAVVAIRAVPPVGWEGWEEEAQEAQVQLQPHLERRIPVAAVEEEDPFRELVMAREALADLG